MDPPKFPDLVTQLDTLVGTAPPGKPLAVDALACFDLLIKLLDAVNAESKDTIAPSQRKCEDKLEALLLAGAKPPIRQLASEAMVRVIEKGENISIYARSGGLQGWLSDNVEKKREPTSILGAAQCFGALVRKFGRQLTSGLQETASIVGKLMKSQEVSVRQAGLDLLSDSLAGTAGGGSSTAHAEALKVITKAVTDKTAPVRTSAAKCLVAIAQAGGPGLHGGGLESTISLCLKGLEDPDQAVREAFSSALGNLLALGANPSKQVLPKLKGGGTPPPAKALEGGLQKFLIQPFCKASGGKAKELRFGLAMAFTVYLQAMVGLYGLSDLELPAQGLQAIQALRPASGVKGAIIDAQAQACVIYVVRVGVVEQMGEGAQRELTNQLIKQLSAGEASAPVLIVMLRTLAYLLEVLGEVSLATREALDAALVNILPHPSAAVRIEVALTIRALALVDPECANGLMSVGVTMLRALRETIAVEKGERLKAELDQLHGQAALLAALLVAAPKLPLGVPSRFSEDILAVARQMVIQPGRTTLASSAEQSVGWMLVSALVAAMTQEEREEHELDLLALWAVPFGGNCAERLKKAEADKTIALELSNWAAAMEALAAFIKFCVLPALAAPDIAQGSAASKGLLLQPVQQYLSASLVYLSSPVLQEANATLKPSVELLTIRTLEAFRTMPDATVYKTDHVALLAICTAPFRDAASLPAASSLRTLLHPSDAALGPWVPGRDLLEDELRAFEGGSDGLLPCVWASETPVFPQPLPQAVSVVNTMLLSFGTIAAAQSEKNKLQLLEIMLGSLKTSKKASYRTANATNVSVGLLGILKAAVSASSKAEQEPEFWKKVQTVVAGVLAADPSSPAVRRAVAESEGLLARLMDDANAARLTRFLVGESMNNTIDREARTAHALALGCIHRSVGGMALAALVPATVQGLCVLARDPLDGLHLWALHALWLTADAAGLAYFPHVKETLRLAMDVLFSEEQTAVAELRPVVARLVNAMVAVLGPELSPGSTSFQRCQAIVSYVAAADLPAADLECVLYAQQLVLFAPQAVPASTHVETLRPTLASRQPPLRRAAIATLRHLSERDPLSMVPQHIEEDLFAMLDNETDATIVKDVRLTLERLLEAACPTMPARWLRLCRNVVLASSATRTAGAPPPGAPPPSGTAPPPSEDTLGENDEEGFGVATPPPSASTGGPAPAKGDVSKAAADAEKMPRYRTRIFAGECLRRLPGAVGTEKAHFDLETAEAERQVASEAGRPGGDWLVLHLSELVGLAFQIATGPMELLRPLGVDLLHLLLTQFGQTPDPHYDGHLLLEQYQAQLVSAVRGAFEPGAGPLLVASGAKLAAAVVTGGVAAGDRGVLQRVLGLLAAPLGKWEALSAPSYAEWVGCTVKVALLQAHAKVKCFAGNSANQNTTPGGGVGRSSTPGTPVAAVLKPLMRPHGTVLGRSWAGLLRDYAVLSQPPAMQALYKPFLQDTRSAASLASIRPMLEPVWSTVLEAVTQDVNTREKPPPRSTSSSASASPIPGASPTKASLTAFSSTQTDSGWGITIDSDEFDQIWGFAVLVLCEGVAMENRDAKKARRTGSSVAAMLAATAEARGVALRALRGLAVGHMCRPDMLSLGLAKELLQALLDLDCLGHANVERLVIDLLEQLMLSLPEEYLSADSALQLSAAELGTLYLHRSITPPSTDEATLGTAVKALSALAQRCGSEGQSVLVPLLLCTALDALTKTSTLSSLNHIVALLISLANANSSWGDENRGQVLSGAVVSLRDLVSQAITTINEHPDGEARLQTLMTTLLSVAKAVPGEVGLTAKKLSLTCLQEALAPRALPAVQISALQAFRTALQTEREWAALVAQEAGPAVCNLVYSTSQPDSPSLGPSEANVVGECLKVLVLIQQLAQGEEAQQAALNLLLPSMIAAATVNPAGSVPSPAQQGLASMAVKLVTHLASVPATAAAFKTVVANLPADSKLQLQAVIRGSMAQPVARAAPPPPKLAVPLPPRGLAPPPIGGLAPPPVAKLPVAVAKKDASLEFEDDEEDDEDWGEPMQAAPAQEGGAEGGPTEEGGAEKKEEEDEWGEPLEAVPGGKQAEVSELVAEVTTEKGNAAEEEWQEPAGAPAGLSEELDQRADVSNEPGSDDSAEVEGLQEAKHQDADLEEVSEVSGSVEGTKAEEKEEEFQENGVSVDEAAPAVRSTETSSEEEQDDGLSKVQVSAQQEEDMSSENLAKDAKPADEDEKDVDGEELGPQVPEQITPNGTRDTHIEHELKDAQGDDMAGSLRTGPEVTEDILELKQGERNGVTESESSKSSAVKAGDNPTHGVTSDVNDVSTNTPELVAPEARDDDICVPKDNSPKPIQRS